jgi:hypothetical protein
MQRCWKKKVLEALLQSYGEGHEDTITAMENVAMTYVSQDQWSDAEVLEKKILEVLLQLHGEDHEDTIAAMENLTATLQRTLARSGGLKQRRWKRR